MRVQEQCARLVVSCVLDYCEKFHSATLLKEEGGNRQPVLLCSFGPSQVVTVVRAENISTVWSKPECTICPADSCILGTNLVENSRLAAMSFAFVCR
jgi:hypothetical protein